MPTEAELAPPPAEPASEEPNGPAAMIRLAAAMLVQDAAANIRNAQAIANASFGAAQTILLGGGEPGPAQASMEGAQTMLTMAVEHFTRVTALASDLLARMDGNGPGSRLRA